MPAPPDDQAAAPIPAYGLPPERLHRAWRIEDIAEYLGIGLTKARALMKQDGAPARLRTGSQRCDRWNPVQVLDWLHAPAEQEVNDDRGSAGGDGPAIPSAPAPVRRGQAALTRPRQRRAA